VSSAVRRPTEIFQDMLQLIAPELKLVGFTRRGNTFRRQVERNVALIVFQRNPDSIASAYRFFVNLAVVSRSVYWFETGHSTIPDVPAPDDYHQWVRLGEMLPKPAEWGWDIKELDDASLLAQGFVEEIHRHGLPWLETNVSDASTVEGWKRALDSTMGGDIRPLKRLSILAAASGDLDLVERAIAKLREQCAGAPCSSVVEAHVQKLAQKSR